MRMEERELRVKGGRVGRVEKEVRERTGGVIGNESASLLNEHVVRAMHCSHCDLEREGERRHVRRAQLLIIVHI